MGRTRFSLVLIVIALAPAPVMALRLNDIVCGITHEPRVRLMVLSTGREMSIDALVGEVDAIWKPYGVGFRWDVSRVDEPIDPSTDFVVAVDDSQPVRPARDGKTPMAYLRFHAGRPRNFIRVSALAAMQLIAVEKQKRGLTHAANSFGGYVERVLGRAIAHELGHILLGASSHSPTGLMRASHPTAAMMQPGDGRFALTAADERLLRARLAAGPVDCGKTTLLASREEP